ncbi:MAG: hypothetical protein R3D44_15005 [Hyphomicrobiaceae bacterium]
MEPNPGAPRPKLPLWRTVGCAYRAVFSNLGVLLRIAWPWLLIMVPFQVAYYWWAWPTMQCPDIDAPTPPTDITQSLTSSLWCLAMTLPWSGIAVGWHRFLLRGETSSAFPPRRGHPFVPYVGVAVLFGFMTILPFLIADLVPFSNSDEMPTALVVAMGIFCVLLLVISRLSVCLPAIAIEGPGRTLGEAWRATRGNTWRLMAGSLLAGMPVIAFAIIEVVVAQVTGRLSFTLAGAVLGPVNLLLIAVGVGFLSYSWRHFYDDGPTTHATA